MRIRRALARAGQLHQVGTRVERDAIRVALLATRGMAAYAADLLGVSRATLAAQLRRQYADLGREARAMRARAGYRRGNPRLARGMAEVVDGG